MPAEAFVTEVLHGGLGARHLVCGPDFAFGHRRGGDTTFLARRAEALGHGADPGAAAGRMGRPDLGDAHPPCCCRTAIRSGRPPISAGHGRSAAWWRMAMHAGARSGFPTANIALGRHLEPARGVYAVTVRLPDGSWRRGVANIGRRPTVNEGPESRLEVNIFDFDGDLYDAELSVALHAYIREERRFAGLDALKAQIAADAAEARGSLTAPASPIVTHGPVYRQARIIGPAS